MQVKKKSSIPVLGAGSWGTALAILLANNGQEVKLWDRDHLLIETIIKTNQNTQYLPEVVLPNQIQGYLNLDQALEGAEDILVAVPSYGFLDLLQKIKPLLTPSHRIVWATKGLEPTKGDLLHEVVLQVLGKDRTYAVLSGPSFAKEVALGLPTAVTLASHDSVFLLDLRARFNSETFRLCITDDCIGVQLGGIIKNILAVAAGLSDGLGFGANARAALITRGLAEMMCLGEALGAKRETFMGLAGCGDIILTCTDNQSRNRRLGLALAKGLTEVEAAEEIGQAVEAVNSLTHIYRLAQEKRVEMPIVEQVYRVVKQKASPREAVMSLFNQMPQNEFGK